MPRARHILVVLDRSGSMQATRADAEGGLEAFLAEQANAPTEDLLTLVQFDNQVETVFSAVPLAEAPNFVLEPRRTTALLDAIGTTVNDELARVRPLPPEQRPDETVVVVVTDGAENASTEFRLDAVKALIAERRAAGWVFVFLGADQDAITVAADMGIGRETSMGYAGRDTKASMTRTGTMISRGGHTGEYGFTEDERGHGTGRR